MFYPDDKMADIITGNTFSVHRFIVTHETRVIHETECNTVLNRIASDVAFYTAENKIENEKSN